MCPQLALALPRGFLLQPLIVKTDQQGKQYVLDNGGIHTVRH
jgi:hypothetical protein